MWIIKDINIHRNTLSDLCHTIDCLILLHIILCIYFKSLWVVILLLSNCVKMLFWRNVCDIVCLTIISVHILVKHLSQPLGIVYWTFLLIHNVWSGRRDWGREVTRRGRNNTARRNGKEREDIDEKGTSASSWMTSAPHKSLPEILWSM